MFHYSTTSAWMFTHLCVYICGTVISALIQSFVVHYVVIICALTRSPVLQHSKLLKSLLWKLSSSLPTHLFSFTPVSLNILIDLHMKSSFPKRDKRQKKQNEFVMPFCCVLNLFTAPSMFHAKSLYFLV